MNNKGWITMIVLAVVFGVGGYYFGAQSKTSATAAYTGRNGAAGRFAGGANTGGFGGGTVGTIISTGNGTMTIQMAASTSSTATTGTKIVLFNDNTVVNELATVPASNLKTGQSVIVSGTSNSDGSVTATSIQVRPAGAAGGFGARTGTTGQ